MKVSGVLPFSLVVMAFTAASRKPNAVIFLVDDLGYADVGCFGNDSLQTPNIDHLAAEGVRLTHNLAPESVCTPSRAAFLTGRYAVRSGMVQTAGPYKPRVFLFSSSAGGLPASERTFATELAENGYRTGLVGKWHQGINCETYNDFCHHPLKHGFHHFYGLPLTNLRNCGDDGGSVFELVIPHWRKWLVAVAATSAVLSLTMYLNGNISASVVIVLLLFSVLVPMTIDFAYVFVMRNLNCILMRDFEIVEQPVELENLTVRFTSYAIRFIEGNKAKPFLLLFSFAKVHNVLFTSKTFNGHSGHSRYGDAVEEMDWAIGKVMVTLERLGLKEDTFVYFTSDHGPHLEDITVDGEYHGGWKGIFRGGKGNVYEGGIRVPTVVSWPGHIPQGIEISEPTNSFDIFPTLLEISGISPPKDRIIDGKSMMPLLAQNTNTTPHEIMIHYCDTMIHAVRYRPRTGTTVWKAFFLTPNFSNGTQACYGQGTCRCHGEDVTAHDPPLLYDITGDPSESRPIGAQDPRYIHVMQVVTKAAEEHKRSVEEVPSQLERHLPEPRLQICCNPPWCSCKEHVTIPDEHSP